MVRGLVGHTFVDTFISQTTPTVLASLWNLLLRNYPSFKILIKPLCSQTYTKLLSKSEYSNCIVTNVIWDMMSRVIQDIYLSFTPAFSLLSEAPVPCGGMAGPDRQQRKRCDHRNTLTSTPATQTKARNTLHDITTTLVWVLFLLWSLSVWKLVL